MTQKLKSQLAEEIRRIARKYKVNAETVIGFVQTLGTKVTDEDVHKSIHHCRPANDDFIQRETERQIVRRKKAA